MFQDNGVFLNFKGNLAHSNGGSLSCDSSRIVLHGVASFANNSVSSNPGPGYGGAVYLSTSNWRSKAIICLHNSASHGGAFYATWTSLNFEGSSQNHTVHLAKWSRPV